MELCNESGLHGSDLTEALALANSLTPATAKLRIAFKNRLLEHGQDLQEISQDLLLYILRMGSFHSTPKVMNDDNQDDDFQLPSDISRSDLLELLNNHHQPEYPLFNRNMRQSAVPDEGSHGRIRVFQWNILAQTLGISIDKFEKCPIDALDWNYRKFYMVSEILQHSPDIICLQEVDHFRFIEKILQTQNYEGIFYPKPDSPCIYTEGNNGPDGCALFYNRQRFQMITSKCKVLEVWKVPSNQVVIVVVLKDLLKDTEICVATTHLKARKGALLSKLRNEQGKDMLEFIQNICGKRPLILAGDFNAEPIEPIYETVLADKKLGLSSAYASYLYSQNNNKQGELDPEVSIRNEVAYTTWKVRSEGEVCHTIDYIFFAKKYFTVSGILDMPTDVDLGETKVPSYRYPSDHFSLMCDFNYN